MALPQTGTIDHDFSAVLQTSALPDIDDQSGSGNDGTSSGDLAHDGTTFDYSDSGDAAEITSSTNTPTGAFSYACRVARKSGETWPPTARIFFASPGSSVNLPGLYYDPAQGASGVIRALIANAGWNTSYDIESWNAADYHTLVMTHDGANDLNVYVDGANVGNFTAGRGIVSALITWGTYNSGQSWGNLMTDNTLWRGTELTPTEVGDVETEYEARNATGADHELTAAGNESATEQGAATLAQVHALAATGNESATQQGSANMGQSHALAAAGNESASQQSAATIWQAHALAASGNESATQQGAATSGQSHALTAAANESTTEQGAAQIAQVHTLSATGNISATDQGSATIGQEVTGHSLTATGNESATEQGAAQIGQLHALSATGNESATEQEEAVFPGSDVIPIITSFTKVAVPTIASFTKVDGPMIAAFTKTTTPPTITTFTKV